MKTLHFLVIIALICLNPCFAFSQCDTKLNYAPIDTKCFPVKKIRIAFQVVTDYLYQGNIPNNSSGDDFLNAIHDELNDIMRNPVDLEGNLSSVDINDTRLEFELVLC